MPAVASLDKAGKPLLSWRVHLLPLLGEKKLYKEFHLDEPWDSDHNKKLIAQMPEVFRGLHPQAERAGQDGLTWPRPARGRPSRHGNWPALPGGVPGRHVEHDSADGGRRRPRGRMDEAGGPEDRPRQAAAPGSASNRATSSSHWQTGRRKFVKPTISKETLRAAFDRQRRQGAGGGLGVRRADATRASRAAGRTPVRPAAGVCRGWHSPGRRVRFSPRPERKGGRHVHHLDSR